MLHKQVLHLLLPHRIESVDSNLPDFLADDLMQALQQASTRIATNDECFRHLKVEYPKYHHYTISIGKI